METILIIIASTLIAACFSLCFAAGFYFGQKYSDKKIKAEAVTVTDRTKKVVDRYRDFANYTG